VILPGQRKGPNHALLTLLSEKLVMGHAFDIFGTYADPT